MSGICGILRFDGGPVSQFELERMTAAAAHRGPDGTRYHCEGPVGLAYQSLEVTPESAAEIQPVRGPGGALLLADARVDNRNEFADARLAASDHPVTDAEILIHALLADPRGAPGRVLGDFAWALWAPRAGELRLARDAMGMRALYYRVEPSRVLFATEVKQILAADNVPRELNELAVAWYLSGMQTPPGVVFYRGIDALLPGYELTVRRDGRFTTRRIWHPDPRRRIRYRSDDEYAEHLRDLFVDSVRARLRTTGPVAISLSGGLDSGSAASVAGWLRATDAPGAPPGGWPSLRAYTWAFTELSQCDERENAHRIARAFGIPVHEIPAEETYPLAGYPGHAPDEDDPYISMFQPFIDAVADAARADGASVFVQGVRGDLVCGGTVTDIRGLVRELRLREARAELARLRRFYGGSRWTIADRYFLRPAGSAQIEPPRERPAGHVNRAFLVGTGLPERDPILAEAAAWRGAAAADRYRHVFSPLVLRLVVVAERLSAVRGMGFADPWSDRRIADYVLAVPQYQLTRVVEPKRIVRRAMRGIMPDEAIAAARKVVPLPLYESALREKSRETVRSLIADSRLADLGAIDAGDLSSRYEAYADGRGESFDIWSTLSLEMWIRGRWG